MRASGSVGSMIQGDGKPWIESTRRRRQRLDALILRVLEALDEIKEGAQSKRGAGFVVDVDRERGAGPGSQMTDRARIDFRSVIDEIGLLFPSVEIVKHYRLAVAQIIDGPLQLVGDVADHIQTSLPHRRSLC